MLDLWYKNAIIYCLDVRTFVDADGDGFGDFQGLADRLDYIETLGANCIWLLPFYPSPFRDNGYDVADYYGVDPRLGNPGDFVTFIREARNRGIRVIIDLVLNHTSVDHPWFQAARRDPSSPYRAYYIWADEKPEDAQDKVVFPGVQESTWTWDEEAGAYYFHRFYDHQPDLNMANPAVREEIQKIMGYWLQLGVSGFRLDAVPFLIESPHGSPHAAHNPWGILDEFHQFLSWRVAEAIMLAEANVSVEEAEEYFDDGNRLKLIFHFPLNQNTFLALAREDARPIADVLKANPELPDVAQWATFLRNHDELDLARLSDEHREEVFRAFAPEEHMQLYHRGIRRRLAPMLGGDQPRLEMTYSLMFALPGTPVLWYGEELGMGEDLSLPERNAVRTPMQWSDEENAGFSEAPADRLVRPVCSGGPFGYEKVNVAAQSEEPGSLLERVKSIIRVRRSCPEVGWGVTEVADAGDPRILSLRQSWRGHSIMTLHNLSRERVTAQVPDEGPLRLLVGDRDAEPHLDGRCDVELPPYGYRWYRLRGERR